MEFVYQNDDIDVCSVVHDVVDLCSDAHALFDVRSHVVVYDDQLDVDDVLMLIVNILMI